MTDRALEMLATRPGMTIQDLGRPGYGELGVGRSGAADLPSLRLANRLVGNAAGAAALEIVDGGFALRSEGNTVLAVTGAAGPLTLVDAAGQLWPQARGQALALADGECLEIGTPEAGLRS